MVIGTLIWRENNIFLSFLEDNITFKVNDSLYQDSMNYHLATNRNKFLRVTFKNII